MLLWRDTRLSGGILAGVTILWLLFEVAEYNFLTLACHLSITAMLIAFIWSNLALLFDREPPRIPELILTERSMKDLAHVFHGKLSRLLTILFDIARGKDLKTFLLVIRFSNVTKFLSFLVSFKLEKKNCSIIYRQLGRFGLYQSSVALSTPAISFILVCDRPLRINHIIFTFRFKQLLNFV